MTGLPGQIADDLRRYRVSGVCHVVLDRLVTDLTEMRETLDHVARDVRPQVEGRMSSSELTRGADDMAHTSGGAVDGTPGQWAAQCGPW